MSRHHQFLISALFICLCGKAYAEDKPFTETFRLSAGASVTTFDFNIRINSYDKSIDETIDLENDLGFNEDIRFYWLGSSWRFKKKHRLSIIYSPFIRHSSTTIKKDITIKDTVITAGASIEAKSRLAIYDMSYSYSLFQGEKTELAFTSGIYWLSTKFSLEAAGDITQDGETHYQDAYRERQRIHAPLPLFGFSASHYFLKNWETAISARYMAAAMGDYSGKISSLQLRTEYYFKPYLGFGIAATAFAIEIERKGLVLENEINYGYSGAQVYYTAKF